ncbi:MAG TPA: TetR/AcrR family transcriptional regulator [Solirubrobacteraceae bacterium]
MRGPIRAARLATLRREERQRRELILTTAERLIREQGAAGVTVASVSAAAGISRSGFHEAFTDLEDCLLAVFDLLGERLETNLLAACAAEARWVDGVRAGVLSVLDFLQESPLRARFLLAGALTAESSILARRWRLLDALAQAYDACRPATPAGALPAPYGAEALLASAVSIVHSRVLEDPVPPLRDLTGPLMALLVMPSLGATAAREELSRPLPALSSWPRRRARREHASASAAPLRMTHRAGQVLAFLVDFPRQSNRAIAHGIGVGDEGQISRLLAKLESAGLIANARPEHPRGAANAWHLSAQGAHVLRQRPSGSASRSVTVPRRPN